MNVSGLFAIGDHLRRLSETGDPLEALGRIIDFEPFRPVLDAGLGYSDGSKGGRPPYDPVTMFKVLILAAQNNVSDERMEFLIRDRLSWLRFLGFDIGDRTPDENTIRLFRERLTRSGTIDALFTEFDRQLRASGYLAMGGQIVDASLVAAPRQRNTATEKAQIKAGRKAREIWKDEPNKAAQKGTDARLTVKIGRPRDPEAPRSVPELAIAVFGYKTHVAIDQAFGFIRNWAVTSAARHDGAVLREIVTTDNTSASVWADTAYRSKVNEEWLRARSLVSRIHRKKPPRRPMPDHIRRGNATKSRVRSAVEHVFAQQKDRMGLFVRTVGIERARAKIGLANIAYNMGRLIFHERRASTA
jgi:transposase, IS5 family